ncbi:MAG: hypothetical protein BWZ03_00343 [bacterium ADurb.BinA186]|nr:MAG: hypothetical protein BWZ03_00343 [bacterium ADurb.BinA186]
MSLFDRLVCPSITQLIGSIGAYYEHGNKSSLCFNHGRHEISDGCARRDHNHPRFSGALSIAQGHESETSLIDMLKNFSFFMTNDG